MEKQIEFEYICNEDGSSEFEDFLNSLPDKDQAKLLAVIKNTEEQGLSIAIKMKWVKKLEDNLYELRSKVGSNIQRAIYFQKIGSEYVITHGFTKKTPKTPHTEIEHAKNLRERYKEDQHERNQQIDRKKEKK
ncbi:type II toxin-antitoxin system RelE/ParE family toxin [Saccharibacillus sp. CPCC 101409]|uniref:type II toxin-antitoxin system RelE/ParE family toxin n=1 Tax=Saccharibacillus sp. CPCC 101409 TaxID=3058041 RepID=UPI00267308F4|nr:type II toxin-antitoxin system RelE/ParE family toxin [Saccharibacillus sp. CPCC 101409]MDO3408164.1 type II toxin-antitoxin system RelE/ParE family toxin [Saccharibacillus sp. CPCC 101409]